MFPLADADGDEREELAQPYSICDADNVCVDLRGHFMAAVTTAGALAMYALGKDSCFLVQAPAMLKRSINFWRPLWGRGQYCGGGALNL